MPTSRLDATLTAVVRTPLLVLLVAWVAYVEVRTGALLSWPNLRSVLLEASLIAIVAAPCALLVIAGYIDLSVGSTLALGGVVAGSVLDGGHGAVAGVLAAVAAGGVVGTVNAVLTTGFGLSSFIVTLGMLTAVRGVALLWSPIPTSNFGEQFAVLGIGTVAGVPVPVVIAAVVLGGAALFLAATPSGRHVYAIGVNREAAYLSGVNVRRIPFALFVFSGCAAGLTGAIQTARLNSAPAGQLGTGYELVVLAAVLLGGVALTGGEGTVPGVVVGVLFLGLLANGLVLLGIPTFWQNVASGASLILAVAIGGVSVRLRRTLSARQLARATAVGPDSSANVSEPLTKSGGDRTLAARGHDARSTEGAETR